MSQITINSIDNGWVISYPYANTEENATEAFTYDTDLDIDDKGKATALQKILFAIIEQEYTWSKHNKYNIEVFVMDHEGKEVNDELD